MNAPLHMLRRGLGGVLVLVGAISAGGSVEGRPKADAEMAVKRASGVVEVANASEVLSASQNDDGIRWETFYRIFPNDFPLRYAL